jgi:phage shock protein C
MMSTESALPTNLFTRDDTIFGVCEALGQDFGFNPLYLRVLLASALLWNPPVVVGTYLGAGLIVMVSRLLAPNPRVAAARQDAARDAAPVHGANDSIADTLAAAA